MPLSATFDNVNGEPANISGGVTDFVGSGDTRLRTHKFTSNSTLTINEPGALEQVLLVAGGGGGGDAPNLITNPAGLRGGGGGAGEVVVLSNLFTWNVTDGDDSVTSISVTVGAAGPSGLNNPPAGNGGDTVFGSFTAKGGGGGDGMTGGSGGGGANWGTSSGGSSNKGSNTVKSTHYGNPGGSGSTTGGGGGGAGGSGSSGSSGGNGGSGYTWIDGNTYAGGGGGGDNESATSQGAGGAGGSGIGGYGRGWILTPGGTSTQNINGATYTGSGGGAGGMGAGGVVIIAVKDPEVVPVSYNLVGSPSSIVEGNVTTLTATTTSVPDATVLYWTINNITTTDADFVSTNGTITINSNTGSSTLTTVSGAVSGTETFTVSLRTGSITGPVVDTTSTLSLTEYVPPASYPTWNTMPTYSEWQGVANTMNSGGSVTYDMVGGTVSTDSDANMYALSVPNGKVFLGPRDENAKLYDPSNQTLTDVVPSGMNNPPNRSHLGPALSTNGKIYIPPFNSSKTVIEYDPSTGNSTSYTDSNLDSGGYYGSTALSNGKIIFKPKGSSNHRLWDPSTNTSSSTNITSGGSGFTYPAMVEHPKDGMVYMLPYRDANIKKWDPTTDTFSTITLKTGSSSPGSANQYQDAILGADGKIYGTPWNSGDIGIFDIDTSFFERYDPNNNIPSSAQLGKGVLGNDGRIYMMPRGQDNVMIIPTSPLDSTYGFSGDSCTSTVTSTNVQSSIFSNNYWDGAVDNDGYIVCCPVNLTSSNPLLRIDTNESTSIVYDFRLSPHINNG